jgi:hypothetical protein
MAEQKTVTQIVGSSIADWVKDPATGKERTPQQIIAAVTDAVLADKSNTYGTTIDPVTGKARPATDAQKVQIALNQLAANAKFEGSRYAPAKEVAKALGAGDGRGGTAAALRNRPDLWAIGKENVGKVIDRKNFDDPTSVKRFVLDPTTNQLTPEQLKEFKKIGAGGGMAIDPVTGFQVNIDSQGRYTLGEQASGDLTNLNYATGQKYGAPGTGGVPGNIRSTGAFGAGNPNTLTAGDGTQFDNFSDYLQYQDSLDTKTQERQSAYDLLYGEFDKYGLGSLVTPLKDLITTGVSPSEFTLRLRETDAYKKRFAANQARIQKGLAAISEAEYIGLEDQYQNIMRQYGLPSSYYTRGDMGVQEGFNKFIGSDVSAAELEDRVLTAQQRVLNANPEVLASLKQFYPGIGEGDILAYALDPEKALTDIKRKVTAAEIGGAATQAGLGITGARAEELGAAGISKAQAQQGFQAVAEVAPRGGQLAAMYGESPYTQQTAEAEVFGLAGSTEAAKQRKKLVGLERAAFSGQAGSAQGALGRERAGII